MNAVLRYVAALSIAAAVVGCAGTPGAHGDTTPSWMKHHVVGSRIARTSDAHGKVSSADYVVVTSAEDFANMPSVSIRNRR